MRVSNMYDFMRVLENEINSIKLFIDGRFIDSIIFVSCFNNVIEGKKDVYDLELLNNWSLIIE